MAVNQEENKSLSQKLNDFIAHNRKVLIIIAVSIAVIIIAIGLTTYIRDRNLRDAVSTVEELSRTYEELAEIEQDSSEYQETAENLKRQLLEVVEDNNNNYPHMKAKLLLGNIYAEEGSYREAADAFDELSENYADTHIAAAAIASHAASLEMLSEYDAAIDRYQYIIDTFGRTSAETSHAYFSIGRLYETTDRQELAQATYEQLVSEYPQSEWSKLAQTRLIQMEIQ
ncbi:MAG: tetratricopeptide repeat protein [Spirochaetota bacterium]